MLVQDAAEAAVERTYHLMRLNLSLARECRGLDLLADRVRTLRKAVTQLETQVTALVK